MLKLAQIRLASIATAIVVSGASFAQIPSEFEVEAERFADLRVLRYQVPGFEELDLSTKTLLYFLYEASLSGREIIYDQKYRYNLVVKRTLEEILRRYRGDRDTVEFAALETYIRRIWFSNGIHHHYSNDKFDPGFSYRDIRELCAGDSG